MAPCIRWIRRPRSVGRGMSNLELHKSFTHLLQAYMIWRRCKFPSLIVTLRVRDMSLCLIIFWILFDVWCILNFVLYASWDKCCVLLAATFGLSWCISSIRCARQMMIPWRSIYPSAITSFDSKPIGIDLIQVRPFQQRTQVDQVVSTFNMELAQDTATLCFRDSFLGFTVAAQKTPEQPCASLPPSCGIKHFPC